MDENLDIIARYGQAQQNIDLASQPLILHHAKVHDDWIDYNGHMNEAFSVFLTGYACDALAHSVGAMPKGAMFTAETHLSYHAEVPRHGELYLTGRLLAVWPKRWQVLYQLFLQGQDSPAVTIEQMSIYTEDGQVSNFPEAVQQKLDQLLSDHQALAPSAYAGRKVGDPKVK